MLTVNEVALTTFELDAGTIIYHTRQVQTFIGLNLHLAGQMGFYSQPHASFLVFKMHIPQGAFCLIYDVLDFVDLVIGAYFVLLYIFSSCLLFYDRDFAQGVLF